MIRTIDFGYDIIMENETAAKAVNNYQDELNKLAQRINGNKSLCTSVSALLIRLPSTKTDVSTNILSIMTAIKIEIAPFSFRTKRHSFLSQIP